MCARDDGGGVGVRVFHVGVCDDGFHAGVDEDISGGLGMGVALSSEMFNAVGNNGLNRTVSVLLVREEGTVKP
jgi:hypothetical protein